MYGNDGNNDETLQKSDEDNCESVYFEKLKYTKSGDQTEDFDLNFPSHAQRGENKLLIEFYLSKDSIKYINQRYSTNMLDFLGDVGGFFEAISILSIIGAYFS